MQNRRRLCLSFVSSAGGIIFVGEKEREASQASLSCFQAFTGLRTVFPAIGTVFPGPIPVHIFTVSGFSKTFFGVFSCVWRRREKLGR